ncbi:MAG: hypothetical protein JSW70_00795 [Syntrophobacterales bacterium]|nr:MAG: hypothetical protein JSW70_00795 [Syntrophobacterales bacterium]
MKALREIKRLKITMLMISWMCLIYAGFHFPLTPVWGDRPNQPFQGIIMEKDSAERAIYVNEMKVLVPKGTEITTARDVRLSFESLHPKQWVFIQAHHERENLVADKIVLIPRYIPLEERGKYRFFTQTGISK